MDMFIIAHEQAHVLLDHTGGEVMTFLFAGNSSPAEHDTNTHGLHEPEIELLVRTRAQETAADELGYRLMVKAKSQRQDPIALMVGAAAPNLVFQLIDSAEAYGQQANGYSFSNAGHPTANDRSTKLSAVQDTLAGAGQPLDGMPDFRRVFSSSLDQLLLATDPLIRQQLGLATAE
ncbi:M48 family metalloprotease [Pseudomonas sp. LF090]